MPWPQGLAAGMDGAALEVSLSIATTVAAPISIALQALRNLRRKSHAFRLPALAKVGPPSIRDTRPHQDTRMVLVAFLPPRAVTPSFLVTGCLLALAKVSSQPE